MNMVVKKYDVDAEEKLKTILGEGEDVSSVSIAVNIMSSIIFKLQSIKNLQHLENYHLITTF